MNTIEKKSDAAQGDVAEMSKQNTLSESVESLINEFNSEPDRAETLGMIVQKLILNLPNQRLTEGYHLYTTLLVALSRYFQKVSRTSTNTFQLAQSLVHQDVFAQREVLLDEVWAAYLASEEYRGQDIDDREVEVYLYADIQNHLDELATLFLK
jgi:hypothetical protein